MSALVLAFLLTAPGEVDDPGVAFPLQRKGDMTASLSLRVPERSRTPARGQVLLELTVTGPKTLEVEDIRLEDALAGWRVDRAASSWSVDEGRVVWSETLHLVQVKPGVVPLPGVTLRLRASPTTDTEVISWSDLLREPRDVAPPEQVPPRPSSSWLGWMCFSGLAFAVALTFALVVLAIQLRRAGRKQPLSANERALAKLEEKQADPAAAGNHLDSLLRTYLQERFGVPALRKTNQELLSALTEKHLLPPEQMSALADLLGWCEMTRFAGVEVTDGWEQVRQQARAFLLATVPVGKEGKSGEQREDAEGG